jgi:hypothetical protein
MTPRYRPPGWFAVRVINPLVRWLGAASTLHVSRRTTGALQRVPVNVVELADGRYLVSVRGRTEWVRNLRAAGRARWGTGQVRRLLDQLPDPDDHPVFRLDPLDPATRG